MFEKLRRMADADQGVACPRCDSPGVDRLLSTFAAHGGGSAEASGTAPCGAPAAACGSGRFT